MSHNNFCYSGVELGHPFPVPPPLYTGAAVVVPYTHYYIIVSVGNCTGK